MNIVAATTAFALLLIGLVLGDQTPNNDDFEWKALDVRLPKPLSDHTASLSTQTGLIYIAGGCDSELGNEFAGDFFFCATISNSLYAFDPDTLTFDEETSLPRQRYRHAAAVIGNELWLVGGRDAADNLLAEVDIYNTGTKVWRTLMLPSQYQTSDHAAFTQGSLSSSSSSSSSFLYIAGGYNQIYGALDTVFRIDTAASTDSLVLEEVAPLLEARGDIFGAANTLEAYVGGGFTDVNGFCAPLSTVEKYDFASDSWSKEPDLINARGEIVLIELDSKLYAMGGERQIENICAITGDTDPGELTVGMELVEVLEAGEWKVVDEFANHKFRFAAVGDDDTGVIYAFGGQTEWDNDCECFKTTNDVQSFGEPATGSGSSGLEGTTVTPAPGGGSAEVEGTPATLAPGSGSAEGEGTTATLAPGSGSAEGEGTTATLAPGSCSAEGEGTTALAIGMWTMVLFVVIDLFGTI